MKFFVVLVAVLALGCENHICQKVAADSPAAVTCGVAVCEAGLDFGLAQEAFIACLERNAKAPCKPCRCGHVTVERLDGGIE